MCWEDANSPLHWPAEHGPNSLRVLMLTRQENGVPETGTPLYLF
jgi:hypothetical protein